MTSKSTRAVLTTGLVALVITATAASGDEKKPETATPIKAATATTATTATTAVKGEKPVASPGWIVIEEDFWYPWRLEPIDWFQNAEMHYRQKEEKKAALEIRKAASWLDFAASHAEPITKKALLEAGADLKVLADDLEKGDLSAARRMDKTVAKASVALAQWHYFKSMDKSLAKSEEGYAAKDLDAAARYLKNASDSARLEYGENMVAVYNDVFSRETVEVTPTILEKHLDRVKEEIDRVSALLNKTN